MHATRNSQPVPESISSNPRFANYFTNCIRAIDDSHVSAKVSRERQAPFRNRKGGISQNVLVFTYF